MISTPAAMSAHDRSSNQIDMPSSYQGIINNALEEGHLEIALETIGLFLSPDYVPSPAHTLVLIYLALHPNVSGSSYTNQPNASSSFSRPSTVYLPSINKLALPDIALSLLHRLLDTHSPVPLARSVPSFDPPSVYWNDFEPDMSDIEREARGIIDWKSGIWNGWTDQGESWGKLKGRTNGSRKRPRSSQRSEEEEEEQQQQQQQQRGEVAVEEEESERVERWWLVLDWLCVLWTKDLIEIWAQPKQVEDKAAQKEDVPPYTQRRRRTPLLLAQIPPETNASGRKLRWNLSHILPLVKVLYSDEPDQKKESDEPILNRLERRKRTFGSLVFLIITLTYPTSPKSQPFLSPIRVHTQISDVLSTLPSSSLPRFLSSIRPSLLSSLSSEASPVPSIEPFKTQMVLSLLTESDPIFPPKTLTSSSLQEAFSKTDLSSSSDVLGAAVWLVGNVAGRSSAEHDEHEQTEGTNTNEWRMTLGKSLERLLDRAGEEIESQAVGKVGRTWVKALKG